MCVCASVFVCVSVCISVYLCVYLCICVSVCLTVYCMCPCLSIGVAFDKFGRRLGRGKGFYDRFLLDLDSSAPSSSSSSSLSSSKARALRCGVALDTQMVAEVPVESHDLRVDCIATPQQIFGPFS